MFIPLLNK